MRIPLYIALLVATPVVTHCDDCDSAGETRGPDIDIDIDNSDDNDNGGDGDGNGSGDSGGDDNSGPSCGDGNVDRAIGEECDAGPSGNATCDSSCRLKARLCPTRALIRGDFNGNGISHADQVCQAEYGNSFRAMISGAARAPGNNWVLDAERTYMRCGSLAEIVTTTASARLPADASEWSLPITDELTDVWTGMSGQGMSPDLDCEDWTTADSTSKLGLIGRASNRGQDSWAYAHRTCNNTFSVVCAEQL